MSRGRSVDAPDTPQDDEEIQADGTPGAAMRDWLQAACIDRDIEALWTLSTPELREELEDQFGTDDGIADRLAGAFPDVTEWCIPDWIEPVGLDRVLMLVSDPTSGRPGQGHVLERGLEFELHHVEDRWIVAHVGPPGNARGEMFIARPEG